MAEITLEYVEQLASQLPPDERKVLAERLKAQSRAQSQPPGQQPQSLRGAWQGKFPDFDLDQALYEIRHEWEKELEEFGL